MISGEEIRVRGSRATEDRTDTAVLRERTYVAQRGLTECRRSTL